MCRCRCWEEDHWKHSFYCQCHFPIMVQGMERKVLWTNSNFPAVITRDLGYSRYWSWLKRHFIFKTVLYNAEFNELQIITVTPLLKVMFSGKSLFSTRNTFQNTYLWQNNDHYMYLLPLTPILSKRRLVTPAVTSLSWLGKWSNP